MFQIKSIKKYTIVQLITIILISMLYFYNALGKTYLFDTSIIYYYAYLLDINYQPFVDFTTPLLPFNALIQKLFYSIFGLNYLSGVIGGYVIVIIEYISLFILFKRINKSIFMNILCSLIIVLSGIPLIGTLYYNHLLISIISVYFVFKLFQLKTFRNHTNTVLNTIKGLIPYLLISFVIMTKIHWGIYLLFFNLVFDFIYLINRKKSLIINLSFFILMILIISMLTNCDFTLFLHNVDDISLIENLNYNGVLSFFNFPNKIFSNIELSPIFFLFIYMVMFFYSDFSIKKYLFNPLSFLFLSLIFFIFLAILNSAETQSIFIGLEVVSLVILFQISYEVLKNDHNSFKGFEIFIYTILIQFLLFLFQSVFFQTRKLWDFNKGDFNITSIHNFNTPKYYFSNKNPELYSFFKYVKFNQDELNEFIKMDNKLRPFKTKNIYFGPELEMFNLVYRIIPLKGFPLWTHPGLSISKNKINLLETNFNFLSPELIVLSKSRIDFYPFHKSIINKQYLKISDDNSIIEIYKKK